GRCVQLLFLGGDCGETRRPSEKISVAQRLSATAVMRNLVIMMITRIENGFSNFSFTAEKQKWRRQRMANFSPISLWRETCGHEGRKLAIANSGYAGTISF
ncbi:MAG: hypothetical protein K8I30_15795, partial [Anaerolineae bacterium]|nr:hypothetical protein [Anaerolineae bacterium]